MSIDFLALGVKPPINASLRQMKIMHPTPIQKTAIPAALAGKDIVAQAQTGTGKTLAFLVPIVQTIDADKSFTQALIVTPTRELALQIAKEAERLAQPLDLTVLAVYGGHAIDRQINQLKQRPHIIIGTPGRLLDHVRKKTIGLSGVSKLVLDEADQMLHMGFIEDVEQLINQATPQRQTMLFSATIPSKIRALADRYMRRPIDIRLQSQNITLDTIKQLAIETTLDDKLDKLCSLINQEPPYLAMIFCHTKQRVSALTLALAARGYQVDEMHGDLSQNKREQILKRFRQAKIQLLITTDIAARGLDVEGVTHVFNYDIPRDADTYIHRIGRTGRAGQPGTAITLLVRGEHFYLRLIEQGIDASIKLEHRNAAVKSTPVPSKSRRQTPAASSPKPRRQTLPSSSPEQMSPSKQAASPLKQEKRAKKTHGGNNLRSRRKAKPTQSSAQNSRGRKRTAKRN